MSKSLKLCFWLTLAVLARLIPHSPNVTPYASLILLMGCQLSRQSAVLITLISLALSDLFLTLFYHYPLLGFFSLFTYSGFIAMALASYYCLHQRRSTARIVLLALGSVGGYWLWTNFGTWLTSGMYPHTPTGLGACFIAGLPFLQASLLSALIFVPLLFGLMMVMERLWVSMPR